MAQSRSRPIAETASSRARPAGDRPVVHKSQSPSSGNGRAFRRKIDCGSSTETSADRLVLRDPGHLLRIHRQPNR